MTDREHEFIAVGALGLALAGALYLSSRTSAKTPAPGGSSTTPPPAGTGFCPGGRLGIPCFAGSPSGTTATTGTAGTSASATLDPRTMSF